MTCCVFCDFQIIYVCKSFLIHCCPITNYIAYSVLPSSSIHSNYLIPFLFWPHKIFPFLVIFKCRLFVTKNNGQFVADRTIKTKHHTQQKQKDRKKNQCETVRKMKNLIFFSLVSFEFEIFNVRQLHDDENTRDGDN